LALDRRAFHRLALFSAAGLALPGRIESRSITRQSESLLRPVTLTSYVDPLPIPARLSQAEMPAAAVAIKMAAFRQKVHRDLPPTTLWGYNGAWPGPTIDVRRNQPFSVMWANKLPKHHLLPLDFTVHGEEKDIPQVRAVVLLHGSTGAPRVRWLSRCVDHSGREEGNVL
jgi:spore coat protein A, manganese oxidase